MIKVETYEELKDKYPIGTKVNCRTYTQYKNFPYYSDNDLKVYSQEYGEVTILDENYCRVLVKGEKFDIVEGHLFDGEYWYPVESTWEGWHRIKEID